MPQTPAEKPEGGTALTRVLMVAGEASGDLHGASLAKSMRALSDNIEILGVGGDRMQAAGVELLYHMKNLAVVGITEVLRHLGDVRAALRALTHAAETRAVDAVVLIDYPDFNLTLARRLRRRIPQVPIIYYISPQVWAWRSGRIHSIARLVDRMLVILPFEKDLYDGTGLPVDFVGHPLLDVMREGDDRSAFARRHDVSRRQTWIALLPGSRRSEVERLLPPMLEAAAALGARDDGTRFLVPVSPSLDIRAYEEALAAFPQLGERMRLIEDDYYATLEHAAAAAVCSGTATLETALADTPMVVVYRTSWLTYNLAKLLVRVRDIALVNLIAGRRAVPELVQGEVSGPRIADELINLLYHQERRDSVLAALAEVRRQLGEPGASDRAARAVLQAAGYPLSADHSAVCDETHP